MEGDPTPLQRVTYVLGARLPQDRHEWVRHDLTDDGWRGRAMLRAVAQVVPVAVLLAFLPGPASVHLFLPLLVVLSGLFVAGAYGEDLRDRLLRQHGLPTPPRPDPPRGF